MSQLPLNALRTLVAVVRHGGVSRAAESLHLTHGAVSHQIHGVQESLNVTLFEKRGRNLVPTREAATYIARIEAALTEIDQATAALLDAHSTPRLRIGTTPSFAARWLLPRLGDFIAANPGRDIEVESSSRLSNLQDGEVDVAIRFGAGDYPGLHSELLMHDRIFPVCSPEFATRHQLADPPNLAGVSLLHADGEPWSWWLPSAGITASQTAGGAFFSDSSLMLQAAIAGQGLGLARASVARDAIDAGLLIRPFTASAETPHSYYFVCRKDKVDTPTVISFRRWLEAQIADFETGDTHAT